MVKLPEKQRIIGLCENYKFFDSFFPSSGDFSALTFTSLLVLSGR